MKGFFLREKTQIFLNQWHFHLFRAVPRFLRSRNQHNIVNINKFEKRKSFLAYFLVFFTLLTVLSRPTSASVFELLVFQVARDQSTVGAQRGPN